MKVIQAALVRAILEQWKSYKWTIQGFGFARTKIADVGRIHVWDSRLAVNKVSTAHAHPWPLRSTIISGELINQRFAARTTPGGVGAPYMASRIATGEGGGLIGDPEPVELDCISLESYIAGQHYEQAPVEIHRSIPQDGTVTLLERPLGPPIQETMVFWPAGTNWVSAEPREAQAWELEGVILYALQRWHSAPATISSG